MAEPTSPPKLLFVVNVDWFFLSHRLPIALEAQKKGYEVHVATTSTGRIDEIAQYGFQTYELSLKRSSMSFLDSFRAFLEIRRIYRCVKPLVVHLISIKPVIIGGFAARICGIPGVVAAVPGLGFIFSDKGVVASLRRFLVGFGYSVALGHKNLVVIFQNTEDKRTISEIARVDDKKVRIIRGSGVDLQLFTFVPLRTETPIVLFAGRLLKDKGVEEFVDAARLLKNEPDAPPNGVRCVIVGEPDEGYRATISAEQLTNWETEGAVEFWGKRDDMQKVISLAQIVVLPSYREGLPKVLAEAAACGRAVITTDVPGCRDAIEPNETGLLVPVRESEPLAAAIRALLDDTQRCREMGVKGRELAERKFDVRSVVNQHLQIYNELIRRKSGELEST
ncbi:MAG: glycosyltransferase family 4 protein [Planctomycetota bacterium]